MQEHLLHVSEAERELLLDLLRKEQRDLPSEIHHTQASQYRDDLRLRRETLKHLLDRVEQAPVA